MVKVVNIVGGGDLQSELDLFEISSQFSTNDEIYVDYDPATSTPLKLRFDSSGPLCMVYRTGKFVITGAESDSAMEQCFEILVQEFQELGIVQSSVDLDIYNKVFTHDVEKRIDLSKFSIFVGFENSEYEPEQNPFLVYRPTETKGVVTIASSGKMVINGVQDRQQAEKLADNILMKLKEFTDSMST